MAYDGIEMLRGHLRGPEVDSDTDDKLINSKLKQCYEVETKIEPFYTGGKIVALPDSRFLCKCGSAVKLVSTAQTPMIKLEPGLEDEEEDDGETTHPIKSGSFGIVATFECDMDEILGFDASPSTNKLVTAHKSQLLRLWSIQSLEVIKTIKSFHTLPINHTEMYKSNEYEGHGDGDSVTWATVAGSSVKIWNSGGENQVSKQIRIEGVPSLGFVKWDPVAQNRRLFVAERNIYCIEQDSGKQYSITYTLEAHYSQVTGLEFGTDNIMISAARDKVLMLWKISETSIIKLKSIAFPGIIESTTLLGSQDLYVASLSGHIRHLDLATLSLTAEPSLTLSDSKDTMVTLHPPLNQPLGTTEPPKFYVSTHLATIYEVSTKKKKKGHLRLYNQYVGSLDEILDVALWGSSFLAVANNTPVIKIYNLASGSCHFLRGHSDIVLSLSTRTTDTHSHLVSAAKDNRLIIWTSSSSEPIKILEGHLASVTSVCLHPTTSNIYSVAEDHFLKCWSFEKCLKSVVAHENEIHAVHLSPNGALVVTASRDKTAKVWDSSTLKLKGTLKGHKKGIWDVQFSTWDQLLITSSADTTLKIWNVANMECIKTLQGHTSSVLRGKFFNSGLQAVSTGTDGTLRIWDLRNCQCLTALEASNDKIWALATTPDGSRVISGSADGLLTIWRDITELKVKEAQTKRKNVLEAEQHLHNVIESGKWTAAIELAIKLKRPFTLLRALRSIPQSEWGTVSDLVSKLSPDSTKTLIEYVEKWNTNTKTSTEAQLLLNMILRSNLPETLRLLKVPALLSYSEKHFTRLLKVEQDVVIMKYLAQGDFVKGSTARVVVD